MRLSHIFLSISMVSVINCATFGGSSTPEKINLPVTALLVGDSIMGGNLGVYLEKTLSEMQGVHAVRHFRVSSGLSGLHEFQWAEATHDFIRKTHADILIVYFGANDSLAQKVYSENRFASYPSPEFEDQYAMKVRLFLKVTAPYVKKVYWIGQPAVAHPEFTVKYPVLNRIYAQECAQVPNAVFIETWKWTSVDNKFVPNLADKSGTKAPVKWDPVHHTPHGGRMLGELILDRIAADVALPLPWPPPQTVPGQTQENAARPGK
ncbi:MAG: hypothetical protein K8S54_11370 [Spirochaetia bacterium]|nr:hypothetical protein [Spirochaetia bacterium]